MTLRLDARPGLRRAHPGRVPVAPGIRAAQYPRGRQGRTAPNLNALAADPAWAKAQPMSFKLSDGANFAGGKGETTGS